MKKDETPGGIEEKIGHAMVKDRILTEAQLKTALDYQRSLGGTLTDVVTKLGFVGAPALQHFLAEANLVGASTALRSGVRMASPEGGGKTMAETPKTAPSSQAARTAVDGGELLTERLAFPGEGLHGILRHRELDPVLAALIRLLVQKGVIGLEEQEGLLRSRGSPP